ncbi:MAG: integrase arm-type DNA-binding domain-containing protein, partial [Gammaproteobacteria bacterium]|nr:integrase arm-type DNA-binding domain-containing protein [Gammaproteobacteria bacterium]
MQRLTKKYIESREAPGMYADAQTPTLYLRVAPGGSKQWVQRIRIKGRRRDLGLGGYPLVSIDEARAEAWENRRAARAGRDPIAERKAAGVPTFEDAARRAYAKRKADGRSAKAARQWWAALETYALPKLRNRPVNEIAAREVLAVLHPIWTAKPSVGRRVRQAVRAVLSWAQANGYATENVADERLQGALAKQDGGTNFRALPHAEISAALAAISEANGNELARLMVRLVVLTACRYAEARLARWSEFD